jgi:hypothetical protein
MTEIYLLGLLVMLFLATLGWLLVKYQTLPKDNIVSPDEWYKYAETNGIGRDNEKTTKCNYKEL